MKRVRYELTDWQEGQRKLDHYNKWLSDPTRKFSDGPYPGYSAETEGKPPEIVESEQKAPVFQGKKPKKNKGLATKEVTVAKNTKSPYNITMLNKKGSEMSKVTNLTRATEIVRNAVENNVQKKSVLETLVSELGITRSNAFVYYTKASKALNVPAGEKSPKVEKAVKANPVTGLSADKAAKKVAEIDRVIEKLKASGQKVASPFAQLGA